MNTKRAVKGVVWSGIERLSVQIIQFIISIILARILSPSDFGELAIILVILNILQTFNEVGFGAALIQKLDRDQLDFSTVFVFNIILGIVLYAFLYSIAPLIALFFHDNKLIYYTRLLGLNLIISSFIVVQRTRLNINVDFKTQAKASIISVATSGCIGIYCAYFGLGVMALIIQSLINNIINTILVWVLNRWIPSLKFSFIRFKYLCNYAYKLIFARLINSVFNEIYSIVIGKAYLSTQLGYFNRAKSFTDLSSGNIASIVQRVSTPLLCEAQNDKQKMGDILIKFIKNTAFISFPILFGLFVLSEPIISVILTEKWLPSAWILKVLCPVGIMFVISTFNINIFNATGRTDLALKSEIIKKTIYIIIISASLFFGFATLVYSQILIALIEMLISTYYTKKQIGLNLKTQFKSLLGIIMISTAMAVIVFFSTLIFESNIMKLIIGIILSIVFYFSLSYIFDVNNTRINTKCILEIIKKINLNIKK